MQIEKQYENNQHNKKRIFVSVVLITLLISVFCLTLGTGISFTDSLAIILNYITAHTFSEKDALAGKIIIFLRLPRIFLAVLAGMGLAISGMMMQSVTRNFLVSPFTLGVSSAAAFGASICIVFGSATIFFNDIFIIGSAFTSAMLSIFIVFIIAKKVGASANSVILVGIALNYFFAALTASLQFFAQENKLAAVVQWTFGSLNRANWDAVIIIGAIIIFCCTYSTTLLLKWNAIASGNDELSQSLGINPEKLRVKTMFLAVLITAVIISFTGVIGFVGLIAPHMSRLLIGNDHKFLLPMSGAIGAALLVLADAVGNFILYPVNVPAGIVVSFLGVPIFIQLILNNRKRDLS